MTSIVSSVWRSRRELQPGGVRGNPASSTRGPAQTCGKTTHLLAVRGAALRVSGAEEAAAGECGQPRCVHLVGLDLYLIGRG